jgi:small-conductance mechanosensitive channel
MGRALMGNMTTWAVDLFGVRLVGVTTQNLHKLILTIAFILGILLIRWILVRIVQLFTGDHPNQRTVFWTRQISSAVTALLIILALVSIWFDNPARFATAIGLVSAGLAFALQKVVTSLAGYLVIIRGKTFSVGDRITMGGVRGDVISLGFVQTRILEMGEPESVHDQAEPAAWVRARQFTGRIVSVTNDKVFDTPVYNYTRDFPFIWEEMRIPIEYHADRAKAEQILLDCAGRVTEDLRSISRPVLDRLQQKYFISVRDLTPKVFYRLTDNWLEMSVRFIAGTHGVRDVKDRMSREILDAFERAGIGIASATYDVVGFPPIRIEPASARELVAAAREVPPQWPEGSNVAPMRRRDDQRRAQ